MKKFTIKQRIIFVIIASVIGVSIPMSYDFYKRSQICPIAAIGNWEFIKKDKSYISVNIDNSREVKYKYHIKYTPRINSPEVTYSGGGATNFKAIDSLFYDTIDEAKKHNKALLYDKQNDQLKFLLKGKLYTCSRNK